MKRRYKLKKKAFIVLILIAIISILLIAFLISRLKSKSYSLEYNIDDYKINENYDSSKEIYYYEITYHKVEYNFIYKSKYLKEKKLINDISSKEENGLLCLSIESNYIKSNPLCSNEQGVVYYKINEIEENEPKSINNYNVYNDVDDIYLWNYKSLSYIKNDEVKSIKLFKKDIYAIPLASKLNEYVLIPDYEQNYSFNKMYVINLNNNKISTWKLDYDISFDSVILGYYDKSIFLLDKKNEIEYELVPHKEKMRIVGTSSKDGIVYVNEESKKASIKELINNNKQFEYSSNYRYILEEDGLYLQYLDSDIKTKVSNQKITNIINIKDDKIYYLVKDVLYSFDLENGEKKLIEYSDWEFNHDNLIFIK